jgi:hypothetical protein
MKKRSGWRTERLPLLLLFVSCISEKSPRRDLVHDSLLEAQAELLEVVQSIVKDAEMSNIERLQSAHLVSNKFTKFGPRSFDRQDIGSTNESEAEFFGSISEYHVEVKDLKIDIFGEIGIATYYRTSPFCRARAYRLRSKSQDYNSQGSTLDND